RNPPMRVSPRKVCRNFCCAVLDVVTDNYVVPAVASCKMRIRRHLRKGSNRMALARAFGAFDVQRVELALDVAKDEVGSVARAYSITSSASGRNDSGIVSPSALAVLRLMISSYFVGC